ncbi:hypothetical protein SAMN05421810_104211 [Amycolatopsis arida]|uniref:Uncharacterized protein n=1 Tax=Amycolatopsis arida TaxID=587909 RepID=A0A1I5V2W7_9PSEU|nr:hypothetical protein [Amycolatopsis arida]TDX91128.1 hypothetical protein CLV69_106210 [Amycolatopsis arida]SFQ01849.1 hypothetical protein SAMN05421810_104211 [Amycolatopsis arida]
MTVRFFLLRPRSGVVGERARLTHVAPAPEDASLPEQFAAYCGVVFGRGEVELLDAPAGMPCESCLRALPRRGGEPHV